MATPQDELEALRAQVAALTVRIYKLEQKAGIEPQVYQGITPTAPTPASPPRAPAPPQAFAAPPSPRTPSTPPLSSYPPVKHETRDLEGTIGKLWLNRIGIVAILIGVSYFLKYAFDNNWIGPAGRVALGLMAGIGVVLWSELFRKKGHAAFSYSLKAVGIGTLYLSLWGAFQVYHLVPSSVAFIAMVVVTASTITLALTQDAEILAAFAMLGGFSTPVLLSTGENHEIVLFSYVILLDVAILAMTMFKPWRRLLVGSFMGTVILYIGWYESYYTKEQRGLTVFFAMVFAAIFAVIPLVTPLTKSRWHAGFSTTLTLLPLVNAAALFLALFDMYSSEKVTLTWYALGLATAYLALSSQFKRRVGGEPEVVKTVNLLHIAIAIAFITIAIPLKLDAHWITLGWLIESAALLYVAVRTQQDFLRYFAGATLSLGIARLLFYDNFHVETLVFNARFATYLVAIAILGGIVAAGERFASDREMPFVKLAGIGLNLLALIALTLEASGYFSRAISAAYANLGPRSYDHVHQLNLARNFSFSAIWLVYGAGLMMFGFWKRSAFVRWQAMVLIAITIAKVFILDVYSLDKGYRILSFIALGVALMGISYIYHRDWLKLAPAASNKSSRGISA
jgi:uncharacterized membrane protein